MHYDFMTRREMIKDMLAEGKKLTAGELAEKFKVSKNTIIHDLKLLSLRMPVRSDTGRSGGYVYTGPRTVPISPEEAGYIAAALESFHDREIDVRREEKYRALLEKLKRFSESEIPCGARS